MWCALFRSVLAESRAAGPKTKPLFGITHLFLPQVTFGQSLILGTVLLLRNIERHRVNRLAACLYGRDSAIGSLLGVQQHSPTNELLSPQAPAVSFNKADQDSLLLNAPDQPEISKVLKLAIIGLPMQENQLYPTSFWAESKVHTTRCKAQGILTEGDTQI
ncbi:unnamed protein product, partial [Ranitomeya imitator]